MFKLLDLTYRYKFFAQCSSQYIIGEFLYSIYINGFFGKTNVLVAPRSLTPRTLLLLLPPKNHKLSLSLFCTGLRATRPLWRRYQPHDSLDWQKPSPTMTPSLTSTSLTGILECLHRCSTITGNKVHWLE